jgi:hypothetical protein
MSSAGRLAIGSIVAAAAACGGNSQHKSGTESGGASAGGAHLLQSAQTTVTGCLEGGDPTTGYILRAHADEGSRATGTSGTVAERSPGSWSRTTGQGGDAVANAPTIGVYAPPAQVYRVVPDNHAVDISANVGKQVTVAGVVQGRVLRARMLTVAAEDCSTHIVP